MEIFNNATDVILDNIKNAREFLDEETLNEFEFILLGSEKIFLVGTGISEFVAKTFAMRLTHIGLRTHVVGESASPPISENDCLVAISGSGENSIVVSAARIAKSRGAKVLAVTSYPESAIGEVSDVTMTVKGRIRKEWDDGNQLRRQIHGNFTSLTPLGTAFELTATVFLDAIISEMMEKIQNPF